jgi:succinate-semialdehyde dehydrogenase/glutarate-semialdehyde dehydrogenase
MEILTINPSTEEVLNQYTEDSASDIANKIESADKAYKLWRNESFAFRSGLMRNAANVLRVNSEKYARLMALEMGKPIIQGRAEVGKCAWVCEYYADNAESILRDESVSTELSKSYIAVNPLGVVLAVMPWNFPFWQVFRFAAPALMAGNTGLLKHSRNTMGCAIEIGNVFREAGFPEGVFRNLVIGSAPVASIIENKAISAVTLTGSTPVGMKVAEKAGSVLKKCVMELGGSDPYIILRDADLENAADICTSARLINSGQSCISAKRFIVEKSAKAEFEELMLEKMKSYAMGDPLNEINKVGPQARGDLRDELHNQVTRTIEQGGRLLLGGYIPKEKGFYYPPTILTDVSAGMAAFDEETFGPVAAIIGAEDEEEAISLANRTPFGLGAAVFTRDIGKGEHIAKFRLEAGSCFVNTFVRSDPRLPFGGIKESGYGRELSHYGIKEFVNIKTVCVA